ncbi:MAG: CHAT domain-containing protein, partial [Acidobacteriota bacterium]|nr:CHAT domain-containing protein [Acidobacteriota bacterium]
MKPRRLAEKLIGAKQEADASLILSENTSVPLIDLAYSIKDICYDSWTSEPTSAQKAAVALGHLSKFRSNREIKSVALWIKGISEITEGKLEEALESLRQANQGFVELGKTYEAAQTRVAKLIPLGLLGEYERAITVAREALEIFESLNDELAAGKIEMNMANVFERQGQYRQAKESCLAARNRFAALDQTTWLVMAENDLARALVMLNEFDDAEQRYSDALEIARKEKMKLTEAEILSSLGNLQTLRGQFGDALRSLELSRKLYIELEMPHQSVNADLEIAEIYQILNLTEEAKEIYESVTDELHDFGMLWEEARARANYGKLSIAFGDLDHAESELGKAAELFLQKGNQAGAGSVKLLQAKLLADSGDHEKALEQLEIAENSANHSEFTRLQNECGYLKGEILRQCGRRVEASELLTRVIAGSKTSEQLGIVANCHVSLAKLALTKDEFDVAEHNLKEAISAIERLRAPIPAEEFRMAFLADKLAPYELSSTVCLKKGNIDGAFSFAERARSRTLFERINDIDRNHEPKSAANAEYRQLREALNWNYGRLASESAEDKKLVEEIARIETKLAELARIDASVLENNKQLEGKIDWSAFPDQLISELGANRVLIEYTLDGADISAFIVDKNGVEYIEDIAKFEEITGLIEGLRFQFETMRFDAITGFEDLLKVRTNKYLAALHDLLVAPFSERLGSGNLVIVPVGPIFYVPFCALYDGAKYLVETRTVCFTPSAAIWKSLQGRADNSGKRALVVAYADEKSPLIEREAAEVSEILESSYLYTGSEANLPNYFQRSANAAMIHLACHGEFRADNPLFSNLRLSDGFLTVRDIAGQTLNADLVTLSACETGL